MPQHRTGCAIGLLFSKTGQKILGRRFDDIPNRTSSKVTSKEIAERFVKGASHCNCKRDAIALLVYRPLAEGNELQNYSSSAAFGRLQPLWLTNAHQSQNKILGVVLDKPISISVRQQHLCPFYQKSRNFLNSEGKSRQNRLLRYEDRTTRHVFSRFLSLSRNSYAIKPNGRPAWGICG